jgi:hypothetical protein
MLKMFKVNKFNQIPMYDTDKFWILVPLKMLLIIFEKLLIILKFGTVLWSAY